MLLLIRLTFDLIVSLDLRVEYSKTKARVLRWLEEILLVLEEMRRSITFLQWKARWWNRLAVTQSARIDVQRGATSYSRRQESQYFGLAERFARLWHPTLEAGGFDISWVDVFLSSRDQLV